VEEFSLINLKITKKKRDRLERGLAWDAVHRAGRAAACGQHGAAAMAGPRIKHRVAYLHDPEVGQYYYGPSHPMKPHRMQLAHQLIIGYELHNKMMCYKPHKASDKVWARTAAAQCGGAVEGGGRRPGPRQRRRACARCARSADACMTARARARSPPARHARRR